MNKIYFLLCSFLFFQLKAQIPTSGLQVSYPFTNGSVNDFSPNNNNLTAFNGPTSCPDRFNIPNCAYLFDGVNDYMVAINPGPKYKKSRSLSFWAKTAVTFNSDGYAVLYYGNSSVGGGRFEAGLNSGCNGLYVDYGFGYTTKTYTNTIDNQWHMYTVVYDSTISTSISSVLYYVDANLISVSCMTYNPSQTVNTQTMDPINIGRFITSIPRYFNGAIDDIYVYDRPLTPAEIITIYSVETGINENSLNSFIPMYPNPSQGILNIKTSKVYEKVEIYNMFGQLVMSRNYETNLQLDLNGLQNGIYSIVVITKTGNEKARFELNK